MRESKLQMRCRLILLISEHPIQQGIRKGGVRFLVTRTRTDRMAYSRQLDMGGHYHFDDQIVSKLLMKSTSRPNGPVTDDNFVENQCGLMVSR